MKDSSDVYKEDFSFLINSKNDDFIKWLDQATNDDVDYALELFSIKRKNNSDFCEANDFLKQFRIK